MTTEPLRQQDTATLPAPRTKRSTPRVFATVMWAICLVGSGFGALDGFFSIQLADSAPQQAAAAGMGCFYVIAPYVLARAEDELTR